MGIVEDLPIEIQIPLRTGGRFTLKMELSGFIDVCRGIMLQGSAQDEDGKAAIRRSLLSMIYLVVAIAKPGALTPEERSNIGDVLSHIDGIAKGEQWKHPDDPVFSVIAWLLRARSITRAEAVDIAAELMQSPGVLDQDAFRGRVNRWVAARGLPPIGQTKRRPRGLTG